MSDAGIKLGQLLCDADIITKRQLSKALQEQIKGKIVNAINNTYNQSLIKNNLKG